LFSVFCFSKRPPARHPEAARPPTDREIKNARPGTPSGGATRMEGVGCLPSAGREGAENSRLSFCSTFDVAEYSRGVRIIYLLLLLRGPALRELKVFADCCCAAPSLSLRLIDPTGLEPLPDCGYRPQPRPSRPPQYEELLWSDTSKDESERVGRGEVLLRETLDRQAPGTGQPD